MSETTTGATPGTDATSEQVQETPQGQTQPPAKGGEDADQLGDKGKAALEREREARRNAEREMGELKARLKSIEEKDLPAAEKAARRLAELEQSNAQLERQVREVRMQSAVVSTASRLGFTDPADAFRLLDISSIELVDGEPKGVEKALKDLLAAKPYLASATRPSGSADAGNAGVPSTGYDMNALIRRAAGRSS